MSNIINLNGGLHEESAVSKSNIASVGDKAEKPKLIICKNINQVFDRNSQTYCIRDYRGKQRTSERGKSFVAIYEMAENSDDHDEVRVLMKNVVYHARFMLCHWVSIR